MTSLEMTLSQTTPGKDTTIFCLITLEKLKRIVLIFTKQNQRSKAKLIVQRQLINVATLPCKIKHSLSRHTTTPKRDKIPQKNRKVY